MIGQWWISCHFGENALSIMDPTNWGPKSDHVIYIYIYIYIERERESVCLTMFYIYIYIERERVCPHCLWPTGGLVLNRTIHPQIL